MNKLDIIICVIVLLPALFGLKNGFLKSIFSLAGIITGLFLATRFNDKLTSLLGFIKTDEKILSIISFITIIISVYLIFTFTAGKISKLNFITNTIDKILGVSFGILKGLIIASIFLILSENTVNFFSKKQIETSMLYSSVINIAPEVYNYVKIYFPNAKEFYESLEHLIT